MLSEHEALLVGSLEQIRQELEQLGDAFTAADELGAIERIDQVAWNAGDTKQTDYRGTFKTVAIFNKGPGILRVGFEATQETNADATAPILLRPFDSIVVPYRGSTIYYGGAAAGAASIFYLRTTQPFATTANVSTVGIVGGGSTVTVGFLGDGDASAGLVAYTKAMSWNGAAWDRARTPNVFKPVAAVAVVAGTPVAIWTPAGGKKFRLMGFALSLTVAGSVILKDAAAEILRTPLLPAGQGIASPAMGNGILSLAANNALNADVSASGSVSGFVFGTEE